MKYTLPLKDAIFIRRYKRFLTDVRINNRIITVFCPNTGSMAGLLAEGNPVRISGPHGSRRKHQYTLEQIQITRPDSRKIWVGVNTSVPNKLAEEYFRRQPEGFFGYTSIKREVKIGDNSRIDLLLEGQDLPPCWVEVKNVTLVLPNPQYKNRQLNQGDIAAFPDAKTNRGVKHLNELMNRIEKGEKAAMVYVIQRADGDKFAPAIGYDPEYAEELIKAVKTGVEIIPLKAKVAQTGVYILNQKLEIALPDY